MAAPAAIFKNMQLMRHNRERNKTKSSNVEQDFSGTLRRSNVEKDFAGTFGTSNKYRMMNADRSKQIDGYRHAYSR